MGCRVDVPDLRSIGSQAEWINEWMRVFIPSHFRTLRLSRQFRDGLDPNNPKSAEEFEQLNQKPIGPPLPPYPTTMKDMRPPRHHLDVEGNWHEREGLPPMLELPDFDVSRCYVQ